MQAAVSIDPQDPVSNSITVHIQDRKNLLPAGMPLVYVNVVFY